MARRKLRFRLTKKPGEKGIFLPESVLNSLSSATEAELKLLVLLAKEGRDKDYLSESDLFPVAEAAGIGRESFNDAMAFFRGAGLVENEEKATPATSKPDKPELGLPVPRAAKARPSYSSAQLAKAAEEREFLELVNFAGRTLKKTLSPNDMATLFSFVDSLCMPYDVIMLSIEHCVTEGKNSIAYVEKLLLDFADREVNTYEKAEEYIKARNLYKSFEGKIRKKLGLGQRSLTSREKSIISAWQKDFSSSEALIDLAFEKTVEKTGKASMSYMNKILENWLAAGFKTPDDVEKGDKKPDSQTSSFDPDEFFSVAVARTRSRSKENKQ